MWFTSRRTLILPADRAGSTHLATGIVLTVDNSIDQSTGSVRLKAVFDNHDHALFPAQFVNIRTRAPLQDSDRDRSHGRPGARAP